MARTKKPVLAKRTGPSCKLVLGCFLKHWQPVGGLRNCVTSRDSVEHTSLLFFREEVQSLGLAGAGSFGAGVQEICYTASVREAECHGLLLYMKPGNWRDALTDVDRYISLYKAYWQSVLVIYPIHRQRNFWYADFTLCGFPPRLLRAQTVR